MSAQQASTWREQALYEWALSALGSPCDIEVLAGVCLGFDLANPDSLKMSPDGLEDGCINSAQGCWSEGDCTCFVGSEASARLPSRS